MHPRKPIDMSDEADAYDTDFLEDRLNDLDFDLERVVEDEGLYESIESEINLDELIAELDNELDSVDFVEEFDDSLGG